jgi:hypothetical protein
MAIEITDEMRQAVREEECVRVGHSPDISKALVFANPHSASAAEAFVEGPDDATFPHISCQRCGVVWLVIPESSKNYDEAVQDLNKKIADPSIESIKPVARGVK